MTGQLSIFSLDLARLQSMAPLLGGYVLIIGGAILMYVSLRVSDAVMRNRFSLIGRRWQGEGAKRQARRLRSSARSQAMHSKDHVLSEWMRRCAGLGLSIETARLLLIAVRFSVSATFVASAIMIAPYLGGFENTPVRSVAFALIAAVLGWMAPGIYLRNAAKARIANVVDGLPDALDLLVICAEAGLALEAGIQRVAEELKFSQPALGEELERTAADLKVLPSQERALERLAERIDTPGVRALAATLSQTMQYGTPLAQAMRGVAAQMRNDALVRLEERANKLPALMTVPMIVLIMPTIFLIVGGPAALRVIDFLM